MAEKPLIALRILAGSVLWLFTLMGERLQLSPYTVWLIALPIQLWCGSPFHGALWRAIRAGKADMNMLVSLSSWAAFFLTTAAVFAPGLMPGDAWQSPIAGTSLIMLSLFGIWVEKPLRGRVGDAAERLKRRVPKIARVLRNGSPENVPLEQIASGQRVLVKPGEQIPSDGEVVEGMSLVDESLWTGVAIPVEKSLGSRVYGGTLNKSGTLLVSLTKTQAEMALARVLEAVQKGLLLKTSPRLADAYARALAPAAMCVAAASAIFLSWRGPEPRIPRALAALASVAAVSCPWTWGFAAPLALWAAVRRASRLGFNLCNPEIFETFRSPDVLVFDKTGLLTEGELELAEIIPFGGWTREALARFVLAAESRSSHPLAGALRRWAAQRPEETRDLPAVEAFETIPGQGVSALLNGRRTLAGSLSWLAAHGIEPAAQAVIVLQGKMGSVIGVAVEGKFVGALVFSDPMRPRARETVLELETMGILPVLASGDRSAAAYRAAAQAGIGEVYADAVGEDKARIVSRYKSEGRNVAIVGEGCRDALALGMADFSLALAAQDVEPSLDVAAETADLVLTRHDLGSVVASIRFGQRIQKTIRENLWMVFACHVLLIPLAAGLTRPVLGDLRLASIAAASTLGLAISAVNAARLFYGGET